MNRDFDITTLKCYMGLHDILTTEDTAKYLKFDHINHNHLSSSFLSSLKQC